VASGIEVFWSAGILAAHAAQAAAAAGVSAAVRHETDAAALVAAMRSSAGWAALGEVRSVLVKGSRFMKMEQVVAAIREEGDLGSAAPGERHAH
jgi:UDP-N-acetylmuramoyl-tripeptide--D-alanyl-D-alanine ligase